MASRRRHDEIYLDLRGRILNGALAPGDGLPSFNELAATYNVSVATINKAIAKLKADGLVRAVKSVGMFVADAGAASKPKGIIGVVLPEMRSSIYLDMIRGISEQSDRAGFTVQLCDSGYDCGKELEHLQNLAGNPQVKGIIVSPGAGEKANTEFFQWLQSLNYPFVFLDRYLPEIETDSVRCDSVEGARAAVEYLLNLGHRRIAFLSAENALDQPWCRDRLAGYEQALGAAGIAPDPSVIADGVGTEDVHRLLDLLEPPTAMFLATNRYLWRVLQGTEATGARSGDTIVVAGFDEVDGHIGRLSQDEIRWYTDTPLIKVIQPFAEIGGKGCELLVNWINGTRSGLTRSVLPPKLVVK
jgi:DNA-binding LacI/PurR family transcriptional regulator